MKKTKGTKKDSVVTKERKRLNTERLLEATDTLIHSLQDERLCKDKLKIGPHKLMYVSCILKKDHKGLHKGESKVTHQWGSKK